MKRLLMIISVSLITTFVLVFFSLTTASKAQRNQNRSLDEQAAAQAGRFFGSMYAKCGGHYYYSYTLSFGEAFLYQCKYEPSTSVNGRTIQPRQLSEADRLNGVDPLPVAWDGLAVINLGLCRHQVYRQQTGPGDSAWGAWSDKNDEFVPLTNRKGNWEFRNKLQARGGEKVIVPVTCDDIPGGNKRASVKSPYWDGEELKIPANYGGWFSLGRGPMRVRLPRGRSYSQIMIDGTNNPRTPTGDAVYVGAQKTAPGNSLAPGLKLGAILIKIGNNGKPFEAFGGGTINVLDGTQIDSSEEIFIAINDSNFADNRGEHVVLIPGRTKSTGEDLSNNRPPSIKRPTRIRTSPNIRIDDDNYSIRLFNCDDGCRALVDDNVILETGFGEDSGWLTDLSAQGRKIRFQVINKEGAIAYGFQVRKGEVIVFEKICGTSRVVGCENNRDFPIGVAREFTYELIPE